MELIYNEDIPKAQCKLVTVTVWPRVRLAAPGDRALFLVTKPGAEISGWTLHANVPYGPIKVMVSTSVTHGELLEVGPGGTLAYHRDDSKYLAVAQALQSAQSGSLIWAYWL